MSAPIRDWGAFRIHVGDCLTTMQGLPDQSVQCCVTSPPYFGLRDYGVEGQIGLEQTPAEFIERLVAVFREVRRVLRDDGTLWLNLGDSYANDTKWGGQTSGKHAKAQHGATGIGRRRQNSGLKSKDLMGIPWRVAFALQADGWYLRQDIVWAKPNPMPESTTDRCTKSHEYIFLLSKSPRYYFDHEAIKEPAVGGLPGNVRATKGGRAYAEGDEKHRTAGGLGAYAIRQRAKRGVPPRHASYQSSDQSGLDAVGPVETRNKRSVWHVATRPFKEAHFATFPPALIEPCVLAGAPSGGIVFDPFGGAGTTCMVAAQHGRIGWMCELKPEYADLAERRVATALFGPLAFGPQA